MTDQKLLMQLLMDSSNMEELNSFKVDDSIYKEIESVCRDMCFALHRKRIQLLDINSYIDSLSLCRKLRLWGNSLSQLVVFINTDIT